jgi:hypothetical protein
MSAVRPIDLPAESFLQDCRKTGAYTDCYVADVDGLVSQPAFVEAFYTTSLFKLERAFLGWFVARPSTDAQAKRLAHGQVSSFAAWRVEEQSEKQLLLAAGSTKSWLMAKPIADGGLPARTRLHFGSAVVPKARAGGNLQRMGFAFHALLGFHRLYSRLLLGAARVRVVRSLRSSAS